MIMLLDVIVYNFFTYFQVPMRQHKDCNFSYAGLKTQVRLAIESKNLYGHTILSGLNPCVLSFFINMNQFSGVSSRIIDLVSFETVVFGTFYLPQVQSSKLTDNYFI